MELVAFKLIHVVQICYLLQNTVAYYDMFYQKPDQNSQSQENNSDMEHTPDHQHHHNLRSNQNNNYGYENDECNNCACNNCDNPPECCKKVCENCPKPTMSMPQFQLLRMSQMPSMSMPVSMSMTASSAMSLPLHSPSMQMLMHQLPQISQIQQMSQMPVQQMSPMSMSMPQIQMPPMQMPIPLNTFSNPISYANQGLVLVPIPLNYMNVLKNITNQEQQTPKESLVSTTIQVTTTEASTTTLATQSTNSTTEVQYDDSNQRIRLAVKPQHYDKAMLESVLKNVLAEYSNGIIKSPERLNIDNDNLMMTSSRRSKPSWLSKFGIVPIPNNMAARLMSQLRSVNSLDRRTIRTTLLVS